MSRTIPSGLATHYALDSQTVALLYKCTRADGEVFGFTDHDRDIVVGGITYRADSALEASQVANNSNLTVDNLDVVGAFVADCITQEDLEAGLWNGCEITVMECNWANPSAGVSTMKRGYIGRITRKDGQMIAEVLGLVDRLQRAIGRALIPTCDVKRLGDERCQADLTGKIHTATITSVEQIRTAFTCGGAIGSQVAGYFRRGSVLFDDGPMAGMEFNVYENLAPGVLILDIDTPYDIEVGVSVTATIGCDRTLETCIATFDNAINHRGFPTVPGRDKLVGEPVQ